MARRPKHPGHKAKPTSQRLKLWGFSCSSSELTAKLYIMRLYSSIRGALKYLWHPPNSHSRGKKLHLLTKCFSQVVGKKAANARAKPASLLQNTRGKESQLKKRKLPERGFRVAQETLGRRGHLGKRGKGCRLWLQSARRVPAPSQQVSWHLPQTSGCQVSGETASVAASGGILGREQKTT